MNKFFTLSAALLLTVSATASANAGLEKSIKLQNDRANEEIQVIEKFKTCIDKSTDSAAMKACHAAKKVDMKVLWDSRSKK